MDNLPSIVFFSCLNPACVRAKWLGPGATKDCPSCGFEGAEAVSNIYAQWPPRRQRP
jgi:hypothetical protein